ncbi:thiamine pyrophosphate-binding protein [Cohnella sp. WQ 127256]|uniref:thiamine pyrophosphate-binding protein n=1 Tax=Cohnella sp. WQ 127256 TaxID=2938790 RepID=UPI0021190A84|nr:thiamine pyrophosphate-binding protein [Cohnella sp. WQ 127256]
MKLSDYVVDTLVEEGVSHVFELIGGAIVHLLDSISYRDDIECVSVRHEQAGAFAAEAYARLNGKLGVAMATSGPGALNLMTGIGSCYFDSVPCLFITGQVNTYEYKFDKPVRQIGFQETDIVSVAKPLTKYAELVTDPLRIRYCLEKAIYMAQSGRPGPVLLDIPMNLQRTNIEPDTLESFYDSEEYASMEVKTTKSISQESIQDIIRLMCEAERPVVLAGGGVRLSGAQNELEAFLDSTGFPMVSSLMGVDVIPHDHPSFYGLIGSYGNRYSNLTLANCDLLIILGSRLDSRQTGTRPDTFARSAKKIHVDIDQNEFNSKVQVDISVDLDIKIFLTDLNEALQDYKGSQIDEWLNKIKEYKMKYPTRSDAESNKIEPNRFMEQLSAKCEEDLSICLDVGQHQMWASQSFNLKRGQRLLNSGGMGSMGFALPAAIGAVLSSGKAALVIAGDGGFQINIQELDTIVRMNLPIKIVVMNNHSLGMVRQFQDLYFKGRKQSTTSANPSFIEIAKAYRIPTYQISVNDDVDPVLSEALTLNGPVFIEVLLESTTTVNPKLVVNRPIEDMSPHLERQELKSLMIIDLVEEMDIPK